MFKIYADLTKLGIVIFVVLSGLAGYALSFKIEDPFSWQHLLTFTFGIFFLSSGSLSLNQLQELKRDGAMPRTANRPLVSGKISIPAAGILSNLLLIVGSILLWMTSELSCALGLLTVLLYNGLYTYWWKPKWIFGAVPGAIPGALPATMGYAANSTAIFNLDSVYLFLIMFLWQMPHFWVLALRYKDDYEKGGVPTLPVALGVQKTLFHIGIYTFMYVLVALSAPLFVHVSWIYLLLVLPFSFKVVQEFWRFYSSNGEKRWLAFFMWVNLSMLVYLFVPVLDKWNFLFISRG